MGMNKGERLDLAKLVRRRERVAKAEADQVAAERLAQFEAEIASKYPANHPIWSDLTAQAERGIAELDAALAARCREEGIRDSFRPSLYLHWSERGENAFEARRAELRKVAATRVDADKKAAKAEIERRSVDVQTQLIAGGLESDEAKAFLESMPTAESLMPTLSVAEIETMSAKVEKRRPLGMSGV